MEPTTPGKEPSMEEGRVRLVADRYELGPVLGVGGMGEVVVARDNRLDREVALKWVRADLAHHPDAQRRVQAEARAAAQLTDPHVVAVFDSGIDAGRPYIVMERLDGRTLADEIAAARFDDARVRDLGAQVLAGLGAAHAIGLVHRDVKPGNILCAPSGWKVADFGIARWVDDDGVITRTDLVLGSPSYLAPERLEGGELTPRSDLYSLGVVLYEARTGVRPFAGDNPWALAMAIRDGNFVPVRERVPEVDPALASVIERAMAHDPARRFADAAAMANALAGVAATPEDTAVLPVAVDPGATQPISRPAEPVADTVATPRAAEADGSATEPIVRPQVPLTDTPVADTPVAWTRRPGIWVAAAALVATVLLVAVLLSVLGNAPSPAAPSPSRPAAQATSSVPTPLRDALDRLQGTLEP
jgi:serine/threonine protein kinase